jgi:hypothetical protein
MKMLTLLDWLKMCFCEVENQLEQILVFNICNINNKLLRNSLYCIM